MSIPFIAYFVQKKQAVLNLHSTQESSMEENTTIHNAKLRGLIMLMFFIMFQLNVVMMEVPGNLMLALSVQYLGWTKSMATLILSVFWFSALCSRATGILLAKYLQPHTIMTIDCILLIAGATLLNSDVDISPTIMFAGVGLTGIGYATTQPACLSWVSQMMNLTSMRTSLAYTAYYIGRMWIPKAVFYLCENHNPKWFLYTMLISSLFATVMVVIMSILVKLIRKSQAHISRGVPVMDDLEIAESPPT